LPERCRCGLPDRTEPHLHFDDPFSAWHAVTDLARRLQGLHVERDGFLTWRPSIPSPHA
jgi:hypothetical protein